MKDSYKVLENGKVDVIDYKDGIKSKYEYEYQDNLEDILKQENMKEYLEDKKQFLLSEIENNKLAIKKNKKLNKIFLTSIISIEIIFSVVFFLMNFGVFIGGINVLALMPIALGSAMLFPILKGNNTCIKSLKKEITGYEIELEEIDKQLDVTIKLLENLFENKTKYNEKLLKNKKYYTKVSMKEELKKMREYLNNYFVFGYHEKEFYNHYKKGTLEKFLCDHFDCKESDREIAMNYFKENGPVLAKKYNKK